MNNMNEKIAFAKRWMRVTKDERTLIEYLVNAKDNQFIGSKTDLALELNYGYENSQFNMRVNHCAKIGIISMTNAEKRYNLVFKLNDDWEDIIMTHSDFDEIVRPSKSPRKNTTLDKKEYLHQAYLRKKGARNSKLF